MMRNSATFDIPEDILDSARMTVPEAKTELALTLYAQGRLAIGKACELAEMSLWDFRQLAAARKLSPHFSAADLDQDLAAFRELDDR